MYERRGTAGQEPSGDPNDRARGDAASATFGSALEVLGVTLRLGVTSFGGPIAHLGYFERTYVRELRWLTGEAYGGLVSLCQLLPGPTSSQVGFLVGLQRAGWLGGLAAWIGFTLPSAALMYGFALLAPSAPGIRMQALLQGLMLTAVVVVAQAVWNMARTLAPDLPRRCIAVLACLVLLLQHSGLAQLATLIGGAVAGGLFCRQASRNTPKIPEGPNPRAAWIALVLFLLLLIGLSGAAPYDGHGPVALASIFYRSGAFVFGGGHVVLPLLQQALVPEGWLSDEGFLAGYGFAQAMPGPLFTLAAYLGAVSAPAHQSVAWALVALLGIFLPGLLLAVGGRWLLDRLAKVAVATAILAGVNAAVVGLLAAALYDPVSTSAVHSLLDLAIAAAAFVVLQAFKTPPILIAALCVGASLAKTLLIA